MLQLWNGIFWITNSLSRHHIHKYPFRLTRETCKISSRNANRTLKQTHWMFYMNIKLHTREEQREERRKKRQLSEKEIYFTRFAFIMQLWWHKKNTHTFGRWNLKTCEKLLNVNENKFNKKKTVFYWLEMPQM